MSRDRLPDSITVDASMRWWSPKNYGGHSRIVVVTVDRVAGSVTVWHSGNEVIRDEWQAASAVLIVKSGGNVRSVVERALLEAGWAVKR